MRQESALPAPIARWLRNRKVSRFRPKVWRFEDPGFAYIKVNKAASTSIEHALAGYAHARFHRGRADEVDEHLVSIYAARYAAHQTVQSLLADHRPDFVFTFVRNPLTRLASCYRDKVVRVRDQGGGRTIFWNLGISVDIGFGEFVRRVTELPDAKLDRHLRSQAHTLCATGVPSVDFVGKFERIDEDWRRLQDRLGLPTLPHRNPGASASARGEELYEPDTAATVAERFREDIERFGYASEVEAFLRSLAR